MITGRAKDPLSLLAKVRRNGYKNPKSQVTDLIGIRVITYYADEVDPVVASIRSAPELTISVARSVDKRTALGLTEFGYRSVHLVAKVRSTSHLGWSREVGPDWFEIQVRTVLEHSWAEIEHEVVYKSGVTYSGDFKRSFSALAGTLEILDQQFESLRDRSKQLAEAYRASYVAGLDQSARFDSARLIGFFLAERPSAFRNRETWRQAPGLLELLRFAGRDSATTLKQALRRSEFRSRASRYARSAAVAPRELSTQVVCVIVASIDNETTIIPQFPEFFEDESLVRAILENRR